MIFRSLQWISIGSRRNPALVFGIVALILISDHFILGPYSALRWLDVARDHFPQYLMISRTTESFGAQYWFPLAAGGIDILSNGYRHIDPVLQFFKIFPDWLVVPILRFIQLFIAGWFTFLICRDSLKLTAGAAIAGGLFLQFHQLNLMEHYFGFGALPLVAWALERFYSRPGWLSWSGVAVLGLAYGVTSTAQFAIAYTVPGLFAWMWLIRGCAFPRVFAHILVFSAFCVVPQVDMIWAMFANAPLSQRMGWDYGENYFYRVSILLLFFLLNYVPLILLTLTAVVFSIREGNYRPLILFLLSAAAYSTVMLDKYLGQFLSNFIFSLQGVQFFRFAYMGTFYMAVGGAWGLWHLSRRASSTSVVMAIYTLAIVSLTLKPILMMKGHARDWVNWGSYTANMESPEFESIAREFKSSSQPFRVAVIEENGLYAGSANTYGLETVDSNLVMYSNRYKNYWAMVAAPYFGRNKWARDSFFNYGSHLGLLLDSGHPIHVTTQDYFRANLLSLANVRYIFTTVPFNDSDLELIESTKPDRYWGELSYKEKRKRHITENFSGRRVMVYRNKSVVPRWFLAGVSFYESENKLSEAMIGSKAAELRQTVLLEEKNKSLFRNMGRSVPEGAIETVLYSPDRIRLDVTAETAAALVVGNSFSPYWRAYVNGAEAPLVPAYGVFWAVPLQAGRHVVEFMYEPPYRFY